MTGAGAGLAAAGVAAGVAGVAAYAGLSAESQLFGRTLVRPAGVRQLALTFDDGPNPVATPVLLEVLARAGVRATFFLIGQFALREPELVRAIAAGGHEVGNHSMTHPRLPLLSAARIRAELGDCNKALEDTLGAGVRVFRPPFGARRPAVLRAAAELGLVTVQWNLIVGDWKPRTPEDLLGRLERGIAANQRRGRGTNVVLHDGGQGRLGEPRLPTVEAVRRLLERVSVGTEFVQPPDWK